MVHFEWDDAKDRENRNKQGVSFEVAQHAFADAKRVIAEESNSHFWSRLLEKGKNVL